MKGKYIKLGSIYAVQDGNECRIMRSVTSPLIQHNFYDFHDGALAIRVSPRQVLRLATPEEEKTAAIPSCEHIEGEGKKRERLSAWQGRLDHIDDKLWALMMEIQQEYPKAVWEQDGDHLRLRLEEPQYNEGPLY